MPKPIGGRGIKAPYETTHIRVPVPIKTDVESLIERFRESYSEGDTNLLTGNQNNSLTSLEEAIVSARHILIQKKSARVSLQKLLTAIYGTEVIL